MKSQPSPTQSSASPPSGAGSRMSKVQDVIKHDVPASVVVFLVAVPLSLGIALASGAPVFSGLISAVIGGILCAVLGGSQRLVAGPAAGMVVIVAGLIQTFDFRIVCAITVLAGLLQILFGLSGVARWALGISPAVVHGMLAGIGVTIVLGQVHVLLGESAKSSPIENVQALPADIVSEHPWETLVGALTLAIMFLWPRLPRQVRAVPAALVAVVVATALATFLDLPVTRVEVPGDVLSQIGFAPRLPESDMGAFVIGVIGIALIASVENLLSAVAVDKMHDGPRSNLSRELIGQGTANAACGALGGLPVTGVIVRSSTNVQAGARSRWSAALHGVWILLFTVFLGDVISLVPMAALAGLLIHVGIKLVNIAHIRVAARHGDLAVYIGTIAGVVLLDLMKGVGIGLAIALVLMLRRALWTGVHVEQGDDGNHVVIEGALTFLSVPRLNQVLHQLPAGQVVHVDLIADYLDHSAFETLEDWRETYERLGGTVVVNEMGHQWLDSSRRGEPTLRRKDATGSVPPFLASWEQWQHDNGHDDIAASAVDSIRPADEPAPINLALQRGVDTYHRHTAPTLKRTMTSLAAGQQPRTLMITCADSRIVPNVITTSGPGDLFVVRNVGNLVPSYERASEGTKDVAIGAALEYAVEVLGIEDIVVCGHTACGAMAAAADGAPDGMPMLDAWLEHDAAALLDLAEEPLPLLYPEPTGLSLTGPDRLSVHNVARQVAHIKSYPFVTQAIADSRLKVAGMLFVVPTGRMFLVGDQESTMRPVGEALSA